MPERLLHRHTSVLEQTSLAKRSARGGEQPWRYRKVEQRAPAGPQRGRETVKSRWVGYVSLHVDEPRKERTQCCRAHGHTAGVDRLAHMLTQYCGIPVVASDADDPHAQQAPGLKPVERAECHPPGQIARHSADH